jgi:AcrR family transcriptional regulator
VSTTRKRQSRVGRRPGRPDTRTEILDAAGKQFAELGYDRASIRGIASAAGVDAALVHHYFGTKEQLFLDAVAVPFDPLSVTKEIAAAPAELRGIQMVRTFLSVWENPVARTPALALMRSALAHESAAALLREFATRVMLSRVAPLIEGPDAELRAEAAVSHMLGLAFARYVIKIEPVASASVDDLVVLVGPTIQRYFDV